MLTQPIHLSIAKYNPPKRVKKTYCCWKLIETVLNHIETQLFPFTHLPHLLLSVYE